MAIQTTKYGVISCGSMAIGTAVPFAFMCSAINWKILGVMIESGGFPSILTVAF
jgi:hypothetical protein